MLATMVALLAWTPEASAYSAYTPAKGGKGNCASCHGDFNGNAGYTSLQDRDNGTIWPTDTMNSHVNDMINGNCAACHGSGAKYPVILSSSNDPTYNMSCMGCHGRVEDANALGPNGNGWGAGLRQAHYRANRNITSLDDGTTIINTQICATCHLDANPANFTPADENTMPYYYTLQAAIPLNPNNPCNVPAGTEAIYGTLGLDNDGDLLIDTEEAACGTNNPPVADAGTAQTVLVNDLVTLHGELSSDPDSDPITYAWTWVSGPTTPTLSDPTAVNPTYTADAPGTWVWQLIVNDGQVDSAPATVSISTTNSPPVAYAGPDQTVTYLSTATLDGSGSSDADGDPLTYSWTLTVLPTGSTATLSNPAAVNPTFTVDKPGTYNAQLVVNDGTVSSAPDTVVLTTSNVAPVANAGPNQSVFVNDLVTLDGSGSTDVDGDPLTYSWSWVSGPSTPTLSDPTAVNPTYTADAPGTWVWQLIVNDGTASSTASTVSISTLNSAPVANAGPDQAVAQNDLVQLNGGGSTDADGDPLTYSWSITSGPDTPALSDPNIVNPTFTATGVGTYTVQLVVNDGTVSSTADTMLVSTTGNTAPVANAGVDQSAYVYDIVTLDGSLSSDPDSDPITYSWSFSSKPAGSTTTITNPTAVNPNFLVDKAGTYVVQLIVNDGALDSAPDTMSVSTLNSAPVANAGTDQSVLVNDTVTLDGSGSSDADGDPLTYSWSLTTVPTSSTATLSSTTVQNPTFVADLPGTYVAQLIVNDGTVSSAPDTVSITTGNSAPVAYAGPDQIVALNDTVTLDGSGSSDADGDPLTYSWSFVSGPSTPTLSDPTAVNPTYLADVAGTWVWQLVVNDGTVNSAADTVSISTSNTQPVANAGTDQNIVDGGLVTLDGSGSYDLDGDPLTYNWAFTGKPAGSTATLSDPSAVNPTFTADAVGTYTVRLIVNDGVVNSLQDAVVITNTSSASTPNIVLAPSSYDFGTVLVGASATKKVAVQNNGSGVLTVSDLTMSGTDFSFSGPTLPYLVFVGQSFYVDVTYSPTAAVGASESLTVTSDDPDSPTIAFAFTGTGTSGVADINVPLTFALGDVVQGTVVTKNLSIQNVGTAPLNISSISLAGTNTDITLTGTLPTSIAAGYSAVVKVRYAPTAIAADSETLTINSDDPIDPSLAVAISGNGVAAGNTTPVANAGTDQSVLTGQTVTLNGSLSTDADGDPLTYSWSFVSGPSTPTLSDPTAIIPTYTADVAGTWVWQLIVNDGTVNSVADQVSITAVDPVPDINLPSATLAFGDVTVNTTVTKNVTIQNVGTSTLTITGISLAGTNTDFALTGTLPTSIAAGYSANVQVTYSPVAIEADSETLTINSDDPIDPSLTVAISGNGVAAGNIAPVANAGSNQSVLTGQTVTLDGSASADADSDPLTYSWSFVSGPSTPTLSSSTAVSPTYTADVAGTWVWQLVVNDGTANSVADQVSITAVDPVPDINLPSATLAFGNVVVGSTVTGNVTIQNVGTSTLTITGISLAGTNADFALTGTLPTSIGAGYSAMVKVQYTPSAIAADSETLTINSDDPIDPSLTVAISGNGVAAPNSAPVANAGLNQSVLTGQTVTLDGSLSTDADSDPLTYSWSFVSGPSTPTLSSSTAVSPTYTADVAGTWVWQLVVNDGTADSVADQVSITAVDPVPDINLPSATLAFGDVEVGSVVTGNVTIENVGTSTLTITGISLAGTNTDFALTGTLPTSIEAGYSANVQVTYSPVAVEGDTETLTIDSDDPIDPSLAVAISGNSTSVAGTPDIATTSAVNFGDVAVGSTARGFVDIQNVGTAILTVNSVATSGSADFVLSNPPATPFTIDPGRQVRVKVEYNPNAGGAAAGSVDIGSDDPVTPTVNVPLSGNGLAASPDIALPATIDFGNVEVGFSMAASVTVQNVGSGDLTITGLSLIGGNADFVLDTAAPITIRGGHSAKVQVTYSPSAVAADAETLQFVSNDPIDPSLTVAVSGNGTASSAVPDINLPVASINFGDTPVGATQRGFVDIQNLGAADLSVTSLGVSGSGDFVLSNAPATPFIIKSGRQVRVKVEYTASVTGPVSGSVDVGSNDPVTPNVAAALSGNGTNGTPDINLPSNTLAFGDVDVGSVVTGSVVIQNVGTGTLNISSISLAGTNTDFALTGTLPTSIAAGYSAMVKVNYSPSAAGGDAETLTINSDDPIDPSLSVAISGNGVTPALSPDINVVPNPSIAYGDVLVGQTKTVSVAIQNLGTGDLTVTNLTMSGSTDFSLASGTPTTFVVTPGHQYVVKVNYNPSATGAAAGSLAIASDDPIDPNVSVSLSGNGVAGVADINLPVTSYDYGNVVTGTTSSGYIAIQNPGTADLTITGLGLTGSADFVLVNAPATPFVIPAGRQVTIRVDFKPTVVSPATATLTIDSNDPIDPSLTVDLLGNGVAPGA